VVENGTVFSGLVVDDVLGMQYFSVESHLPDPDEPAEAVHPFLQGPISAMTKSGKSFPHCR